MSCYSEVVPMDWRAMSRSRSRAPMDWRATSRSRSRPPASAPPFEYSFQDGERLAFPSLETDPLASDISGHRRPHPLATSTTGSALRIPISTSASGRHSPSSSMPNHFSLPAVYENVAEQSHAIPMPGLPGSRNPFSVNYAPSLSAYPSPTAHPSSLPSFGLHGLSRLPAAVAPPEQRSFPRHVRKTSFDHTVSKEGILAAVTGRHQVNGKPSLAAGSLIGTKRRADAPHAESMLRGDPPSVAASPVMDSPDGSQRFPRTSPFPSTPFNFSFSGYNGFFDLQGAATLPQEYGTVLPAEEAHQPGSYRDHPSHPSSLSTATYSPNSGSPPAPHERLSAAAAAASTAIAEGYVRLSTANLTGVDETGLNYHQHLMGLMYSSLDGTSGLVHHPYTHVDPTQILSGEHGDGAFASLHPSPSSDGWNGFNSSNAASPEPHNASNASTPPSAEGSSNGNGNGNGNMSRNPSRKIASTKRVKQDSAARSAAAQRKRAGEGGGAANGQLRSSTSTPDLGSAAGGGQGKGGNEEGDAASTVCTNCQTTNTPLWRRDPEGQPLCKSGTHLAAWACILRVRVWERALTAPFFLVQATHAACFM